MQFADDSGFIIKRLLSSFDKCRQPTPTKKLRKVMDKFYAEFVEGEKYYRTQIPELKARVHSNANIVHASMIGHYFLPDHVRKIIQENISYQLEYRVTILERDITIRIALFNKNDLMKMEKYAEYVSFICVWLHICIRNASITTCKELSIYLYPTKIKKRLPQRKTDNIGVNNANSAFTTRCPRNSGEIIIYREEEWKKVFIHETFHTFCFDINPHTEREIHSGLSRLFAIPTIFSASEAYADTWARIMNAAYASFTSTKRNGEGVEEFAIYLNFSLQIERMFSLLQMKKILGFQDINYDSLFVAKHSTNGDSKSNGVYREDSMTNVFGYYILSGILMNGYEEFIIWCQAHNFNLFKFTKVPAKSDNAFVKLIEKCSKKEQCKIMDVFGAGKRRRFMNTTARMSVIELSG